MIFTTLAATSRCVSSPLRNFWPTDVSQQHETNLLRTKETNGPVTHPHTISHTSKLQPLLSLCSAVTQSSLSATLRSARSVRGGATLWIFHVREVPAHCVSIFEPSRHPRRSQMLSQVEFFDRIEYSLCRMMDRVCLAASQKAAGSSASVYCAVSEPCDNYNCCRKHQLKRLWVVTNVVCIIGL